GHVGILRVGDDERARTRVGLDLSELGVEGFHGSIPKSECRRPKEIRIPKPEPPSTVRGFPSDFGLRISFGFRVSDFGFPIILLPSPACPSAPWPRFGGPSPPSATA